MRGDEIRVVDAFCAWLLARGWSVEREVSFVDVLARHPDGRVLFAEAKGRTSATGLDIDTLYGQLLRRMDPGDGDARYAVVVPSTSLAAALRVSENVRAALRIDVFSVSDEGLVTEQ